LGDRAPTTRRRARPSTVRPGQGGAEALALAHPNAVVVRTSLIYGLAEMDNGTAWMAAALRAGQPVTLFTNQRRNPVWVETLVGACLELLDLPTTGVLNVAGRQTLSRADYARGCRVVGCHEREPSPPRTAAAQPVDCTMDLSRAAVVATAAGGG
jgi:dTDP-4-dehydrorhamnose reductase